MSSAPVVDPVTGSGARIGFLIVGAHEGGQQLARVLFRLGADRAAGSAEVEGESSPIARLNREILASAGAEPPSIEPFNPDWYLSPRRGHFRERAIALVREELAGATFFVLDDPAIGRLLPFWLDVLGECGISPAILNLTDPPERFAETIGTHSGIDRDAARLIWLSRALDVERAGRGYPRSHLMAVHLVEDWESALGRVRDAFSIAWPAWSSRVRAAIFDDLRGAPAVPARSAPAAGSLRGPSRWIADIEEILARWSQEGEQASDYERLDQVFAAFGDSRELLAGAFDRVVDLSEELRTRREHVETLRSTVAELERRVEETGVRGEERSAELASLREALADVEAERDRLRTAPVADRDELARIDARWAEVFGASRQAQENLAEQNGVFQQAIDRLTSEVEALRQKVAEREAEVERLQVVELAFRAEAGAATAEVSQLRKLLDEAREETAQARAAAALAAQSLASPENSPKPVVQRRGRRPFAAQLLGRLKPKSWRGAKRHKELRHLIESSGLFDAAFYAARYPDVVAAGDDLLNHFIRFGGREGRHPSAAFNSRTYLRTYPDVEQAGMNPLVHYLEHGREEGRTKKALSEDADAPSAAPRSTAAVRDNAALAPQVEVPGSDFAPTWQARETGWKSLLGGRLGRRPPTSLEDLAGARGANSVAFGDTVIGVVAEGQTAATALRRLGLFRSLRADLKTELRIGEDAVAPEPGQAMLAQVGCGYENLADAWYARPDTLNMRLAGEFRGVVRAFQVNSAGELSCVAEAELAGEAGELVELTLSNPLLEVLVVLTAVGGEVFDATILPFPSLFRGGLHYGELSVFETAPGTLSSLRDYTQSLLLDLMGWEGGPASHTISRVAIDMRGASGTEPIFRDDVLDALAGRFGIAVEPLATSDEGATDELRALLDTRTSLRTLSRNGEGGTLVLPCDMIPSIYGIVARRGLHAGSASRFVVVDAATLKVRADVCVPHAGGVPTQAQHADLPAHAPYVIANDQSAESGPAPVFPLAVRHHNPLSWQIDPLIPVSPDQPFAVGAQIAADPAAPLVTAIVDVAGSAADLGSCLAALFHQTLPASIEVVLAGWPTDRALPQLEGRVTSVDGRELPRAARLNAAAALTSSAFLVFLDPQVLMSDPRTLAGLIAIAGTPGVASAACALVTELDDDGGAAVHSAGYFPTRISLCGEPVFEIDRLDVAQALPCVTYPVIANQTKCCVIPREAWSRLAGFDATRFPAAAFDLDFGYRAVAAGLTNFCTTLLRAATERSACAADFPDPLAVRSVRPSDWQAMFDRVTVIREMRR